MNLFKFLKIQNYLNQYYNNFLLFLFFFFIVYHTRFRELAINIQSITSILIVLREFVPMWVLYRFLPMNLEVSHLEILSQKGNFSDRLGIETRVGSRSFQLFTNSSASNKKSSLFENNFQRVSPTLLINQIKPINSLIKLKVHFADNSRI